jgi:hypothetical protein
MASAVAVTGLLFADIDQCIYCKNMKIYFCISHSDKASHVENNIPRVTKVCSINESEIPKTGPLHFFLSVIVYLAAYFKILGL